MTDIKICGLSTPETIDAAVTAGASHVGFVFFAPSPRHLAFERGAMLGRHARGRAVRVGVFVAPDDALLDAAVRCGLDVVQLHGDVPPARLAQVRARYGLPVWRAAGVATRADVSDAAAQAGSAELLLFDAKAPRDAALPGGNGVRFDWRVLDGIGHGRRWGLSGGLDPANVGAAVRALAPPLVDVSSGVEDAPGVKSVAKIKAFIEAVRTA